MSNEQSETEAFEQIFCEPPYRLYDFEKSENGAYLNLDTLWAFNGWQAARSQPTTPKAVSDGKLIKMANSVFDDQVGKSESRRDNDIFYLRFARAVLKYAASGEEKS